MDRELVSYTYVELEACPVCSGQSSSVYYCLGMWQPSLLTILLLGLIHCKRYKRYEFGS